MKRLLVATLATVLLTAGVLVFLPESAFPQAAITVAQLNGTVRDSSGSVVANATVSMRNIDTNRTYTSTSNASGYYIVPNLPPGSYELKVVYTGFLIFAFIGYFTIALLGLIRVGPGYESIVAHYRGSELDEDAFARPIGQMLEEAHFHAFIEGLILLVLAHLFLGASIHRKIKTAVVLLAFGSTLTDLASPWLIKYVAPGFAYLQMMSWVGMEAGALLLIGVPFYEMWFKGETR